MSKTKSLNELTTVWYSKLKDSGFDDIEWYDPETGKGQNSDFLKNPSAHILHKYKAETASFYQILTQFAHNYDFKRRHRDKFIITHYAAGATFREILALCVGNQERYRINRRTGRVILSLFSLHHILKRLIEEAYEWHAQYERVREQDLALVSDESDNKQQKRGRGRPPKAQKFD